MLAPNLLVGVQRLFIAMLVGVVAGGVLGVLLRVFGKAVGRVAVVGRFLVVALLEMVSCGAVVLDSVLIVVGSFFVGFNCFLVLFGMVSHDETGG